MEKICIRCKTEQDMDEFHNRSSSPDGKTNICKSCRQIEDKARNRAKTYGTNMHPDLYDLDELRQKIFTKFQGRIYKDLLVKRYIEELELLLERQIEITKFEQSELRKSENLISILEDDLLCKLYVLQIGEGKVNSLQKAKEAVRYFKENA
jgi:hypothetical protein